MLILSSCTTIQVILTATSECTNNLRKKEDIKLTNLPCIRRKLKKNCTNLITFFFMYQIKFHIIQLECKNQVFLLRGLSSTSGTWQGILYTFFVCLFFLLFGNLQCQSSHQASFHLHRGGTNGGSGETLAPPIVVGSIETLLNLSYNFLP